jgi:alpha-D-ribose 1-methylphosphonate 5-triphosphate synthase subunit PhnG
LKHEHFANELSILPRQPKGQEEGLDFDRGVGGDGSYFHTGDVAVARAG